MVHKAYSFLFYENLVLFSLQVFYYDVTRTTKSNFIPPLFVVEAAEATIAASALEANALRRKLCHRGNRERGSLIF